MSIENKKDPKQVIVMRKNFPDGKGGLSTSSWKTDCSRLPCLYESFS